MLQDTRGAPPWLGDTSGNNLLYIHFFLCSTGVVVFEAHVSEICGNSITQRITSNPQVDNTIFSNIIWSLDCCSTQSCLLKYISVLVCGRSEVWTGNTALRSGGICVVFLLHPDSDQLIISYQFLWEHVTIPSHARAHTHTQL